MAPTAKAPDAHCRLICYSWEHRTIVHQNISLEDVANGLHRRCNKRVAILKDDYNPDDLQMRRKLQQLKITRWFQLQHDPEGPELEIGVLPSYPDPVDYLKELKRKYQRRD